MFEDCAAKVFGKRSFLKGSEGDRERHDCRVVCYDPVEETMQLAIESSEGNFCSLDSTYEFVIFLEDYDVLGQGYIRERYSVGDKKTVLFQIQNGFYKNLKNDKKILTNVI